MVSIVIDGVGCKGAYTSLFYSGVACNVPGEGKKMPPSSPPAPSRIMWRIPFTYVIASSKFFEPAEFDACDIASPMIGEMQACVCR